MFASEMKILTLSAAANVTAVKSNHIQSSYNNKNCDNICSQKSQNSNKLKYLNNTTNKYHNNNNTNNNSSNNKNSKKHHNSNSNYNNNNNISNNNNNNNYSNNNINNSTSSLNRKKYYQQQQKQSVTNNNYNNNNNNSNNNNKIIKNHNNIITTTQTTSTVEDLVLQPKMVDNVNNNNNNSNNNNYIDDDDIDYLTIFNNNKNNICTPAIVINNNYSHESSSISQKPSHDPEQQPQQQQSTKTILFLNETHTKLSPTTPAATNAKSKQIHSNSNGYWTNFNKQQTGLKSKQSQVTSTTCNNNTDFQEFVLPKIKGSNTKKNKSFFKTFDSKTKQQLQQTQKQQQSLDDSYSADETKFLGNSDFFSLDDIDSIVSSKPATTQTCQQFLCNTIAVTCNTTAAMTTALATAATAKSTAPTNTSASSPLENSPNSLTNVVPISTTAVATSATKTLQQNLSPAFDISPGSASTTSEFVSPSTSTVLKTSTSTPASTSATTSAPNSYSLDFLHSVGVQMTGGSTISTSKATSNNTSNPRQSHTYSNSICSPSTTVSQGRSLNYTFNSTSHRQNRYLSANQHHGNHYQQHGNHYQHHHHHQPQQLTIASFMQKELTESFAVGNNNNSSSNSNNNSSNNNNNNNNSSSNSNVNNYEQQHYTSQQQQRYQNYYQYQNRHHRYHPQQQNANYTSLQHAYNNVGEAAAARPVSNGGNGGASRQSYHNNYQSSGGSQSLQNARHHQQNINHSQSQQQQLSQHYQQQNKKTTFSSSSNSSCSSSSSSSISSISSQTSAASTFKKHSSTTNLNFAIETLPSKSSHYTPAHRGHRTHHNNTHQHHHQQQHQHQQQHNASNTPTTPQHQNFYNLTYVATDSLAVLPSTTPATASSITSHSRGCSPSSPTPLPTAPPQLMSVKSESPALLINLSQHHQQPQPYQSNANRYFQQHPAAFFTQQHHQKLLTVPSSCSSTSGTPPPLLLPPPSATICCSQLDEATTAAAAAAAAVTNDSLHSAVATSSATNSIIAGSDYDSDSTSSTHSTTMASTTGVQHQQKYKQVKSSSLSSTSSASSAQEHVVIPQIVQNPIDFAYAFSLQHQHQRFPQQLSNQPRHVSPQQQQNYRNGVVSLINMPTAANNNNYVDKEGNTLAQLQQHHHPPQQQQQPHQGYITPDEHLTVTTPAPGAGTVSSGYWSPSPSSLQNSNYLYSSAASMLSTGPPSCGSSTSASLSPCLTERDEREQVSGEQHTEGTQFKRSQLSTLQRNSQINSGSSLRLRGRSQQNQQLQQQPQQQTPHSFQQPNLFYGSSSQHLRSSSSSSVQDFFSHTPPDRFLARAHLIEAKEIPNNLLNSSKWDILSQGIWDKFVISQQTEETFKQKMRLWRYLYIFIKNTYPRYGLYLVGSTISGFGADTSDVDMCLVSRSPSSMEPRQEALISLVNLRDCLAKSEEFENFNLIEAKVPILRFRDRIHQLEVDLNYNNCVGIKNTHLLYCYSQLDWRLRPLVLVIKLWAQFHNINNAKNMTISSYSLVLMVIHFLQYAVSPSVLPCLHDLFPDKFPLLRSNDFGYVDMNESIGPYESKNSQTVGELFLHFLEYYSCFDYTQFAISIRTGGLMPINVCRQAKTLKNDIHQWKELCIEEPFELTNTARSVYDFETFERVKAVFVASWRILQETLDVNAVFSPIIITPQTGTMLVEKSTTNINPITTYAKAVSGIEITGIELSDTTAEATHQIEERIEKGMNYKNNNNNNNCSSTINNISSSKNNNSDGNNNTNTNTSNNSNTNTSSINNNANNNNNSNSGPNILTALIS